MILSTINLNILPVFMAVYKHRSMTKACLELHMTQSGISQHIRNLEDTLGVLLFDRIKQTLIPTSKAIELYERAAPLMKSLGHALELAGDIQRELKGTVRIGLPVEYGNNVIVPLLAEYSKHHPLLHFEFELGFASLMNEKLLKGELDFAFVDDYHFDPLIERTPVQEELIELCMAKSEYEKHLEKFKRKFQGKINRNEMKFFEFIPYVNYEKENDILKSWFKHHYNSVPVCRVVATIMDVQGILKCIMSGMGAGILPRTVIDLVNQSQNQNQNEVCLHTFKGPALSLTNQMSLAIIQERSCPYHVQQVLLYLKNCLGLAVNTNV